MQTGRTVILGSIHVPVLAAVAGAAVRTEIAVVDATHAAHAGVQIVPS